MPPFSRRLPGGPVPHPRYRLASAGAPALAGPTRSSPFPYEERNVAGDFDTLCSQASARKLIKRDTHRSLSY